MDAKSVNAGVFPLRLDFTGPDAPHFLKNPNNREGGWINASVALGKHGKDRWLAYNDAAAAAGVGGYIARLRYAEAPSNNQVSTALAADPSDSLPSASTDEDEYCFVVSAVDLLGNESGLPDADKDCVSHGDYMADADSSSVSFGNYPAGLLAGVDLEAPTVRFTPGSPKANATSMKNFQVQVADEGSGIRAKAPVTAEAHVRDAKETDEIDPLGLSISLPLATTTGLPAGMGYYTFVAETADRAGNSSEEVMRTALHDTTPPQTNTIVGEYDEKTGRYSLVATVTDNLSIKDYWAEMRFDGLLPGDLTIANNLFLPREGGVAVDAYNAPDLTTSTLASSFMAHTYRAVQTDATTLVDLASIGVFARDHATETSAGALGDGVGGAVTVAASGLTAEANGFDLAADAIGGDTTPEAGDYKVFQTLVAAAKESGGTVELTATATGREFLAPTKAVVDDTTTTTVDETASAVDGTQGLRDNPISRVDFYAAVATGGGSGRDAMKFIGSVDGRLAGSEDIDTDDNNANDSRKYTYSLEVSKADFLATVGGTNDYGVAGSDETAVEDNEGAIVAFAVKDNKGVAFQAAAAALVVKK